MNIFEIGLSTTLIGMGGIFLVLAILSVCTILVNRLINSLERKRSAVKAEVQTAQSEPIAESMPVAEAGISPRTVAAIMAAISATTGGRELHFVAIRRASTINNAWTASGNEEIIRSRQQYL